jgi:glycosyltransferase involved in cell wall biosynthesis
MRILMVTEQYLPMVGGVSTVTENLSQDLAAAGHQVWVAAPSEGHYDQRVEHGRVHLHRFSSFEWPAYDGLRIALLPLAPLRRLLRVSRPDVVHIQSPLVLGNLALLLAGSSHIPVVATNHYMPINMAPSLNDDPLLGKSFKALAYSYLVSFYNRCDFITCPTATALAMLKEHGLKVPSRPISNGIDLRRFAPRPRDEALRRRLELPADRPLALYVGRISEEKRVDVLLDAIAQLRQPAHLALGGSGPIRQQLEARAAELNITRRVSFLGHVPDEDLVDLYRLADLFVMPSVAELQSVATLEALAVGLPVVAADAGALPELVRDGENGLLFSPDDSAALARRLDCLAADPGLRVRLAERAPASALPHDRLRVLGEWQTLYTRLAAEAREARDLRARHPSRIISFSTSRRLQAGLARHYSARAPLRSLAGTGGADRHASRRDDRRGVSAR